MIGLSLEVQRRDRLEQSLNHGDAVDFVRLTQRRWNRSRSVGGHGQETVLTQVEVHGGHPPVVRLCSEKTVAE